MADQVQTKPTEAKHSPSTHPPHVIFPTSLFSNTLAIAVSVILIVIIIWGLLHFANLSGNWFSPLFKKSNATIVVSAPASATSGNSFTVSWKYAPPSKGAYAFLYGCTSGFHFETPGASGASNMIPCGAAFTLPITQNTLSVTPILAGTSSLRVSLAIIFIPSSASTSQVQGNAAITVNPAAPATPTTSAPAKKKPYASPADLSVQILSANVDASGMASVVFDIANIGGSSTGVYYFTAQLPTASGYTYSSPAQSPLGPGDHVVNTLHFTQAVSGTVSVSVGASDANQSDNYASQYLSMPYTGGYNNYNPQPYQTYPY